MYKKQLTTYLFSSPPKKRQEVMCDMIVSLSEIEQYYKHHNISDYPKTKSGKPNMRYRRNRCTENIIKREKLLAQNKSENMHTFRCNDTATEPNYRKEIVDMTDEEIMLFRQIKKETCTICSESLDSDFCKLRCDHVFCVSCIAQHCRENNNCPLCRKEICCKPKRILPLNEQFMTSYVEKSLLNQRHYLFNQEDITHEYEDDDEAGGSENRETKKYNIMDAIEEELNDYEHVISKTQLGDFDIDTFREYKDELIKLIRFNVTVFGAEIAIDVRNYYDSQI